MHKLDSKTSDLVRGAGPSFPMPTLPSRPVPIFKPLFPLEP